MILRISELLCLSYSFAFQHWEEKLQFSWLRQALAKATLSKSILNHGGIQFDAHARNLFHGEKEDEAKRTRVAKNRHGSWRKLNGENRRDGAIRVTHDYERVTFVSSSDTAPHCLFRPHTLLGRNEDGRTELDYEIDSPPLDVPRRNREKERGEERRGKERERGRRGETEVAKETEW